MKEQKYTIIEAKIKLWWTIEDPAIKIIAYNSDNFCTNINN